MSRSRRGKAKRRSTNSPLTVPLDTLATESGNMVHPQISIGPIPPDFGTPELRERHVVVLEGDSRINAKGEDAHHLRVTDQRTIDRLWRNGRIDWRKYSAAERLHRDFTRAGMEPRLVINLGKESRGGGSREWTPNQLAARENTNRALKATSPLNDILWDVVLCDHSLTNVEIARGWRPGVAFVMLDFALESLARHYRIEHDDA